MKHISRIKGLLSTPRKIAIVMHERPDGDAIGSSIGLKLYLEKMGHDSRAIAPTGYPSFLKWLPGESSVVNFETEGEAAKKWVTEADLIFCLDFNQLKRSGGLAESIADSKAIKVMIDHHLYPEDFVDCMITHPTASSTAEMIFDFIDEMGDKGALSKEMALNLYTGVMTDTGSFRFSSTTAKVHRVIADLVDLGVEPDVVYNLVYNSFSLHRLKFYGFCLNKKMITLKQQKLAYIAVSSEEMKKYNIGMGDTEGLVNYPLMMKNIDVSILFKEQNGIIKISFRSKGDKDVNLLASKFFNGGGHKNASGGMSSKSLPDTLTYFEGLFKEDKFHF